MIPNGGTFVRPGVIAWDGTIAAGAGPRASSGYSSCEGVERAIAAALADAPAAGDAPAGIPPRVTDLLAELASARLWLPLPHGPGPVTDGSAVVLPLITSGGTDFVAAFTSVQRLAAWADPRAMRSDSAAAAGPVRSGDPAWVRDLAAGTGVIRHIVVSFPGLAGRLPPGLGIAVNPGTRLAVRVCPGAVACLAAVMPLPLRRGRTRRSAGYIPPRNPPCRNQVTHEKQRHLPPQKRPRKKPAHQITFHKKTNTLTASLYAA